MAEQCKYCNNLEDKQRLPGLVCEICKSFVHLTCLRSQNTPGNFECDVFFEFTCEDCAPEKTEMLVRNKFQWVNVLILTMNHLQNQMQGISNRGFFHYKTHICSFIDRHWLVLFGPSFKRTKNWVGTVVGVLSLYNSLFFRSGSSVLAELGWWKLMHSFSPAVAAHIVQELGPDKPKRVRNQISLDTKLFNRKVEEMGYGDYFDKVKYKLEEYMVLSYAGSSTIEQVEVKTEPVPYKKLKLDTEDLCIMPVSSCEAPEFDTRTNQSIEDIPLRDSLSGFEFHRLTAVPPTESSSVHSYRPHYDSDSHSSHPEPSDDEPRRKKEGGKEKSEEVEVRRESLFSTQLNSVDYPWEDPEPEPEQGLVEMTEYQEIQLLKTVEGLIPRVKEPCSRAELYRLRAKLALRRRKRHKHLPLFDIDRAVRVLSGYVTEGSRAAQDDRILDRFQRSYFMDNLCGTVTSTVYGPLLLPRTEAAPLRSAFSGAVLKPYIRRDAVTRPMWIKVLDEIVEKTKGVRVCRPPLDYCYVQPHHIPAVNALCAQFFWPGIDLTEALQYPEFSCVCSLGRLVVGCAFLVPVSAAAAYISFVLVRPEYRGAGIATFMLYHLLQTCAGRDVTLHVSPTNPAIFLYQKFGFKVEELVQDFYEKYYDIDYKGCRHALFLRLTR
ncbi:cysteine-rich protein 2-binding protein [Aricia agestis]|uniref:cysteine-rich protein 2-binding protein n=1 Tax=Aricia agestis TaxID=91739 RepID=UPI001C207EF8|nr:cysteine-rich protein 2-binding protein [Aricia agestis]